MTSDIIKGFNRDTGWLATGVLSSVVFAALVLAVQEHRPTNVNPKGELVQAGSERLLDANVVTAGSVVAKSSNDQMVFGEGSVVDQAFNKTSPQVDPSSQIEPVGTFPAPDFDFTPEVNRDDRRANSATLACRQVSARAIEPKGRNGSNRSLVPFRYVGVKRRLIELWHQSLATDGKARSWMAFSNLNRGARKKAAYTAETNH